MAKNYSIIFDTETAGTLDNPFVYDFGGVVADNDGIIVESFNFLISDIIDNKEIFNESTYFVGKAKYNDYRTWREYNIIPTVSLRDVKNIMRDMINVYNVKHVYAYHANFDIRALANTVNFVSNGFCNDFWPEKVDIRCIMSAAHTTICMKKEYIVWACASQRFNKSGNIYNGAETVYQFITKNPNHVESHTALSDAIEESYILNYIRKRHGNKKIDWSGKNWYKEIAELRKEIGY